MARALKSHVPPADNRRTRRPAGRRSSFWRLRRRTASPRPSTMAPA